MQGITVLSVLLVILGVAQAFAPRYSPSSSRSRLGMAMASDKPLTELCEITKEACDAVAPMLKALYEQIKIGTGTSDTASFKSDATFFTIADGIVQVRLWASCTLYGCWLSCPKLGHINAVH